CGVHANLRAEGFPGCAVFDCFGAGQKVSQGTFGGRDWRRAPDAARRMFRVFPVMRRLHELLCYLDEALARPSAAPVHEELRLALDEVSRLTDGDPEELARSEEHTSELQSRENLVCRLLLEKKNK